jgi:hypothetical protein
VVVGGLPSTGTWILTRNPGNIIVNGTGTSTLVSGLTAGTHYFSVTNASGCVSSASADVIINTQPPIPNVPNQTVTIQSGETFNVTPAGQPPGTIYTWTAPVYTGAVSGGSAQIIPQTSISGTLTITSGSGTAIYIVTPVSGSCTGAPFNVTVNQGRVFVQSAEKNHSLWLHQEQLHSPINGNIITAEYGQMY